MAVWVKLLFLAFCTDDAWWLYRYTESIHPKVFWWYSFMILIKRLRETKAVETKWLELCDNKALEINTNKPEEIVSASTSESHKVPIVIHIEKITFLYRYLGVMIEHLLSREDHLEHFGKRRKQSICFLRRFRSSRASRQILVLLCFRRQWFWAFFTTVMLFGARVSPPNKNLLKDCQPLHKLYVKTQFLVITMSWTVNTDCHHLNRDTKIDDSIGLDRNTLLCTSHCSVQHLFAVSNVCHLISRLNVYYLTSQPELMWHIFNLFWQ